MSFINNSDIPEHQNPIFMALILRDISIKYVSGVMHLMNKN